MSDAHEPAARLARAIADAEPRLRGLSETAASHRPAAGRWSPKEIIRHLIDSASNNHQRFVRARWQHDLVFPGHAQGDWVKAQRYQEANWAQLVTLWAEFNRHLAHVMAGTPAPVCARVHGRHNLGDIAFRPPTSPGQVTLRYFMDDYVDHLEHHLRQVFDR